MELDLMELDPGIREAVAVLRAHGFQTTDSGDGVSKLEAGWPAEDVLPFKHVWCALDRHVTPAEAVRSAHLAASIMGEGWTVELSYQTHTQSMVLLVRELDEREQVHG